MLRPFHKGKTERGVDSLCQQLVEMNFQPIEFDKKKFYSKANHLFIRTLWIKYARRLIYESEILEICRLGKISHSFKVFRKCRTRKFLEIWQKKQKWRIFAHGAIRNYTMFIIKSELPFLPRVQRKEKRIIWKDFSERLIKLKTTENLINSANDLRNNQLVKTYFNIWKCLFYFIARKRNNSMSNWTKLVRILIIQNHQQEFDIIANKVKRKRKWNEMISNYTLFYKRYCLYSMRNSIVYYNKWHSFMHDYYEDYKHRRVLFFFNLYNRKIKWNNMAKSYLHYSTICKLKKGKQRIEFISKYKELSSKLLSHEAIKNCAIEKENYIKEKQQEAERMTIQNHFSKWYFNAIFYKKEYKRQLNITFHSAIKAYKGNIQNSAAILIQKTFRNYMDKKEMRRRILLTTFAKWKLLYSNHHLFVKKQIRKYPKLILTVRPKLLSIGFDDFKPLKVHSSIVHQIEPKRVVSQLNSLKPIMRSKSNKKNYMINTISRLSSAKINLFIPHEDIQFDIDNKVKSLKFTESRENTKNYIKKLKVKSLNHEYFDLEFDFEPCIPSFIPSFQKRLSHFDTLTPFEEPSVKEEVVEDVAETLIYNTDDFMNLQFNFVKDINISTLVSFRRKYQIDKLSLYDEEDLYNFNYFNLDEESISIDLSSSISSTSSVFSMIYRSSFLSNAASFVQNITMPLVWFQRYNLKERTVDFIESYVSSFVHLNNTINSIFDSISYSKKCISTLQSFDLYSFEEEQKKKRVDINQIGLSKLVSQFITFAQCNNEVLSKETKSFPLLFNFELFNSNKYFSNKTQKAIQSVFYTPFNLGIAQISSTNNLIKPLEYIEYSNFKQIGQARNNLLISECDFVSHFRFNETSFVFQNYKINNLTNFETSPNIENVIKNNLELQMGEIETNDFYDYDAAQFDFFLSILDVSHLLDYYCLQLYINDQRVDDVFEFDINQFVDGLSISLNEAISPLFNFVPEKKHIKEEIVFSDEDFNSLSTSLSNELTHCIEGCIQQHFISNDILRIGTMESENEEEEEEEFYDEEIINELTQDVGNYSNVPFFSIHSNIAITPIQQALLYLNSFIYNDHHFENLLHEINIEESIGIDFSIPFNNLLDVFVMNVFQNTFQKPIDNLKEIQLCSHIKDKANVHENESILTTEFEELLNKLIIDSIQGNIGKACNDIFIIENEHEQLDSIEEKESEEMEFSLDDFDSLSISLSKELVHCIEGCVEKHFINNDILCVNTFENEEEEEIYNEEGMDELIHELVDDTMSFSNLLSALADSSKHNSIKCLNSFIYQKLNNAQFVNQYQIDLTFDGIFESLIENIVQDSMKKPLENLKEIQLSSNMNIEKIDENEIISNEYFDEIFNKLITDTIQTNIAESYNNIFIVALESNERTESSFEEDEENGEIIQNANVDDNFTLVFNELMTSFVAENIKAVFSYLKFEIVNPDNSLLLDEEEAENEVKEIDQLDIINEYSKTFSKSIEQIVDQNMYDIFNMLSGFEIQEINQIIYDDDESREKGNPQNIDNEMKEYMNSLIEKTFLDISCALFNPIDSLFHSFYKPEIDLQSDNESDEHKENDDTQYDQYNETIVDNTFEREKPEAGDYMGFISYSFDNVIVSLVSNIILSQIYHIKQKSIKFKARKKDDSFDLFELRQELVDMVKCTVEKAIFQHLNQIFIFNNPNIISDDEHDAKFENAEDSMLFENYFNDLFDKTLSKSVKTALEQDICIQITEIPQNQEINFGAAQIANIDLSQLDEMFSNDTEPILQNIIKNSQEKIFFAPLIDEKIQEYDHNEEEINEKESEFELNENCISFDIDSMINVIVEDDVEVIFNSLSRLYNVESPDEINESESSSFEFESGPNQETEIEERIDIDINSLINGIISDNINMLSCSFSMHLMENLTNSQNISDDDEIEDHFDNDSDLYKLDLLYHNDNLNNNLVSETLNSVLKTFISFTLQNENAKGELQRNENIIEKSFNYLLNSITANTILTNAQAIYNYLVVPKDMNERVKKFLSSQQTKPRKRVRFLPIIIIPFNELMNYVVDDHLGMLQDNLEFGLTETALTDENNSVGDSKNYNDISTSNDLFDEKFADSLIFDIVKVQFDSFIINSSLSRFEPNNLTDDDNEEDDTDESKDMEKENIASDNVEIEDKFIDSIIIDFVKKQFDSFATNSSLSLFEIQHIINEEEEKEDKEDDTNYEDDEHLSENNLTIFTDKEIDSIIDAFIKGQFDSLIMNLSLSQFEFHNFEDDYDQEDAFNSEEGKTQNSEDNSYPILQNNEDIKKQPFDNIQQSEEATNDSKIDVLNKTFDDIIIDLVQQQLQNAIDIPFSTEFENQNQSHEMEKEQETQEFSNIISSIESSFNGLINSFVANSVFIQIRLINTYKPPKKKMTEEI